MSTTAGRSSRRLFKQFSNVPNGIPVTESGRVVYSVEPLHAEVLLAHRLAYQSQDPRCGGLRLYDDTFLSEVRAVLSRSPEDIDLPASFDADCIAATGARRLAGRDNR